MREEGEGERKTGRERGSVRGRESHQIRAPLVTSVDPRDLLFRLLCGGQGLQQISFGGTQCSACQHPRHRGESVGEATAWLADTLESE